MEDDLLGTLDELGLGSIAFTVLAQGLLSDRFLRDSNAKHATFRPSFRDGVVSEENLARLRALEEIARGRGQTLAQMAISWVIRPGGVTSALLGVSSIEQLDENIAALDAPAFSDDELAAIDAATGDGGVNIWSISSDL